MRYSERFKEKMLQKMAGSHGRSAASLSADAGVSQATLSRWRKEASSVPQVTSKKISKQKTRGGRRGKRPQDWTTLEKMRAVVEASELSDEALGEFLRREGLHQADLDAWRTQTAEALAPRRRRPKVSAEAKHIRMLEKELLRKDKALAEAAALIVLKKKALEIWGDEDDDTDPRSGK